MRRRGPATLGVLAITLVLLATSALAMPIRHERDAAPEGDPPVAAHDPLAIGSDGHGRSTGYLPGIDVASWQHPGGAPINWGQVRGAGYRYVFVKATEGTTYTNPYYAGDVAGASAAGMSTGAYHYARPSRPVSNARNEAIHFANTIGPQTGATTIPPVLDLEEHGGLTRSELAEWTRIFLDETERLTNRRPILYTGAWFWNQYVNSTAFGDTPLWLANYTSGPAPTMMPVGWSDWTVWQWTSSGIVPGIVGYTDLNRFRGSLEFLHSLGRVNQGQAPTGHLDLVHNPAPGVLRVRGWAVDRDIPWDPVAVHIYSNGVGRLNHLAQDPRPDLAEIWPAAGPNHGFDVEIEVPPGNHHVCVYAIDLPGTGGGNSLLGCRNVWVVDPNSVFRDVYSGDEFYMALAWAHAEGIVEGWEDGSFRPLEPVSRGAAAAFLHRYVGFPDPPDELPEPWFGDIGEGHPFRDEIAWLAGAGLATGYDDLSFRATDPVSRQAAVAFLWRLAGAPAPDEPEGPTSSPFSDVGPAHPFGDAIRWAAAEGITTGYADGSFRPTAPVSRLAMAVFLHRLAFLEA
ncbi:MAG: S-layer homology domain-containing protein [Acidimicrobiia bacterium]|nr:S-layer homology domain-containing protein [Acidimicrobiia bacterium]